MRRLNFLFVMIFTFILSATYASNASSWKFNWNQNSGISVSYDKMIIDYGSQLVCASPDFKQHYYYPPKVPYKMVKTADSIVVKSDAASPSPFFVDEHSV
ncbi:MAG: hypothetical protein WC071_13820, partial [Victivallaceae bacterium]